MSRKQLKLPLESWYLWARKHWLWHLCAFAFWAPRLQSTLGILKWVPYSNLADAFYSREFALQRYSIYLVILIVLIYTRRFWYRGVWATLAFAAYVLLFPFLVVVLVVYAVLQVLGLTLSSLERIGNAFLSKEFLVVSIVAWPFSAYMLQTETTKLLILFMVLLGLSGLRPLMEIVRLGAQPLRLVDKILRWFVPWYRRTITKKHISAEELLQLAEGKFMVETRDQREKLVDLRKIRKFLIEYLKRRGAPHFVTSTFIFIFVLAFALAAFTFAFEFRALCRISPDSLQGLPANTFLDFLFFSVMWLCTSSPDGVTAASSVARLLVALETLTGVALLIFLIQCFSLVLAHDIEQGRVSVRQIMDGLEKDISVRQAILSDSRVVLRRKKVQKDGRAARREARSTNAEAGGTTGVQTKV